MADVSKVRGFQRFWRRQALLASLAVGLLGTVQTVHAAENVATHKQVRSVVPTWEGTRLHLNTFCVGPDRQLYLCCQGPNTENPGMILVMTGEGELVRGIRLDFAPQAINFSEAGKMFVSGSGKVARLSAKGEVEISKDAPNIRNREEMEEELKKAAEEQRKMVTQSYNDQLDQIKKQIAALQAETEKADPADEKGAAKRKRRMKMLEQQQTQWETIVKDVEQSYSAQNGDAMLQQMMRSSGLAVAKTDIFVSLPMTTGYGYSIYRLDHDLENPKVVVKNVGGCCGQLDIQSDGENLMIAENTSFKVAMFNRDGKRIGDFGKRGRDQEDGFGSCCNPMNVRCCENGEILTAESSIGDIKRFSKDGEFLGLVGRASVGGGCKHVAIGWDSERNWHFMMNQDKSSVAVLVPRDQAPEETDEEKESRIAMEGLGKKLIGTWEIDDGAPAGNADGGLAVASYLTQSYGHLEFGPDGELIARPATPKKPQVAKAEGSSEEKTGVFGALAAALGLDGEPADTSATEAAVQAMVVGTMNRKSTWKALSQSDTKLHFVMVEDDVQGYGASVRWISDDEIELSWFYGTPETSMAEGTNRYKRISCDACGKTCAKPESTSEGQ